MLPKSHCQAYQELLTQLVELQQRFKDINLDPVVIKANWQKIKQVFQEEIIILTSDELDIAIASQWQSIQTEIYRALRLLETDIMFFCASQKATTSESRLASLSDRLDKIIDYCQILLSI